MEYYARQSKVLTTLITVLGGLVAVIMGIGGITESGFSNNNTLVVGSEKKMIEVADRIIIVADHTKFGRGAMFPVAPLEAADVVVSDAVLAPEYRELLRRHEIDVRLA